MRWLITWAVTDRKDRMSYLMEVYEGPAWEAAVVKKLETHKNDRSYPGWCVVMIQKMGSFVDPETFENPAGALIALLGDG